MRFSEYYEIRQKIDELEVIDESILTAIPQFIGGAATNLGSQLLKGAGNVVGGAARGAIAPNWQSFKGGLGQAAKGLTQIAASPTSAAIRGIQAAMEPSTPTSLSPGRTWFQKTFGLNAWTPVPKQLDSLIKDYDNANPNRKNVLLKKIGLLYIRLLKEMMPDSKELDNFIKSYESIPPENTDLLKKTVQSMAKAYMKKAEPENLEKLKKERLWDKMVKKYKETPKEQVEIRASILKELEKIDPEKYQQTLRLSKQAKEEEKRKNFFANLATT
jgi:hypothetical protein